MDRKCDFLVRKYTIWQPCSAFQAGVRIFAQWVVVDFGHSFENYRNRQNFRSTFFQGKSEAYIFTINGLSYILGDFFKNSSGHTGFKLMMISFSVTAFFLP
jgi:hypothetical protein